LQGLDEMFDRFVQPSFFVIGGPEIDIRGGICDYASLLADRGGIRLPKIVLTVLIREGHESLKSRYLIQD
jgi:hypothetical protein